MRSLLVLFALLLAPGCLYLGGINHEPEGEISIEASSARLWVTGSVTLKAAISDPDHDEVSYEWSVEVVDAAKRRNALTRAAPSAYLAGVDAPVIGTGPELNLDPIPMVGTYTASLRASDDRGAARTRTLTFEVKNTAPSDIVITVQADPAARDEVRVPDINGSRPAHASFLATVAAKDLEKDLACGLSGKVTWKLQYGAPLKLEQELARPCQYGEALAGYRFRFAPAALKQAAPLTIRANIDDGQGGKAEGKLELSLSPNRPACIQRTDPPISAAPGLPVLALRGRRFEATHVSDDVRDGPTYSWSLRLAGEQTFRELPGQRAAAFVMPPWFRLPGDQFELRVRVRDSLSALPACAEAALCGAVKGLPEPCYQGITWKVRML